MVTYKTIEKMKKSIVLLSIFALVIASCNKEIIKIEENSPVKVTLKAGVNSDITKATYTLNGSTNKYEFAWEKGDKISIGVEGETVGKGATPNANVPFTADEAGSNTTITGTLNPFENKGLIAIYPYLSYSGKGITYQILKDDKFHLDLSMNYNRVKVGENKAESSLLFSYTPNVTLADGTLSASKIEFEQLLSQLRVNVTNVPADYKVIGFKLVMPNGNMYLSASYDINNKVWYNYKSPISTLYSLIDGATAGENTIINIGVIPGAIPEATNVEVQILLKGSADTKLYSISKTTKAFAKNTIYRVNVDIATATDLIASAKSSGKEEITVLDAASNEYKAKLMPDGNYWFTSNLRYLPTGVTPVSDVTSVAAGAQGFVFYPVVSGGGKELSNDAELIKSKGYLYDAKMAFNSSVDITPANIGDFVGTQGLCPDGWHIPTFTDMLSLCGKSNSVDNFVDAPLFDGEKALISKANALGLNFDPANGYVNIATKTATKGTILNVMTYIWTSAPYTPYWGFASYSITNGVASDFTNLQFYGIMLNNSNGSCNGAFPNYRVGATIRCVKSIHSN